MVQTMEFDCRFWQIGIIVRMSVAREHQMPWRKWLLLGLTCLLLTSCDRRVSKPVREALAVCKLVTLRASNEPGSPLVGDAIATEDYFDRCMQSQNYRHMPYCATDSKGNEVHPMSAYAYVTDICELDECAIETCYRYQAK
jgi:hypothetical protein